MPKDLEEAAMIDGCDAVRSRFRRVILPLTLPGIAAPRVAFVFTAAWSELLFALMLISSERRGRPSRSGLLTFVGEIRGRLRADDGGLGHSRAHPGLPLLHVPAALPGAPA
jgi:ABC-type glycerol-3-phosphate transport system permease component